MTRPANAGRVTTPRGLDQETIDDDLMLGRAPRGEPKSGTSRQQRELERLLQRIASSKPKRMRDAASLHPIPPGVIRRAAKDVGSASSRSDAAPPTLAKVSLVFSQ